MTTRTHQAWAGALVAAALACAHAPPEPVRPPSAVVWPEAPAAPRVRLVAVIPSPDAPPPRRSFWRRLASAIVGTSPEERAAVTLVRPFGVAAAADGTVFVADPDLPGVVRTAPDGTPSPVTCASRDWMGPMAVALGPGGELLVADAAAAEIVAVSPAGGCRTFGSGALVRPTGVARAGDRILVADPPRHEVVVFSADGALVGRWGAHGTGEGQLNFPTALVPSAGGGALVVDALNFRIVRFDPTGAAPAAFGEPGAEGGAFARPKGVALDGAGRVYVTDAQRDLVLVYDASGRFEYAAGASGGKPGEFQHPAGVAVLRDRLYVADSHNHRVQVFEILGGSS